MGKKIKIGILLVGIAAIVFLSVRFFILFIPQKAKPIDPEQGLAYLTSLEAEDLSSREAAVAERQSEAPQTALPTEQGTSDLTQAPTQPHHVIEDGNFRKAFGDIVIAGDSQHSLIDLMDRVMAGETVYPGEAPKVSFGNVTRADLTERELDILRELTGSLTNEEIAEKLNISPNTVKRHIQNIMEKTGFESRLDLAMNARALGLVVSEENRKGH